MHCAFVSAQSTLPRCRESTRVCRRQGSALARRIPGSGEATFDIYLTPPVSQASDSTCMPPWRCSRVYERAEHYPLSPSEGSGFRPCASDMTVIHSWCTLERQSIVQPSHPRKLAHTPNQGLVCSFRSSSCREVFGNAADRAWLPDSPSRKQREPEGVGTLEGTNPAWKPVRDAGGRAQLLSPVRRRRGQVQEFPPRLLSCVLCGVGFA